MGLTTDGSARNANSPRQARSGTGTHCDFLHTLKVQSGVERIVAERADESRKTVEFESRADTILWSRAHVAHSQW